MERPSGTPITRAVTFEGVALREPAHYAAAIAIPHAGAWKLYGLQGIFAEYQVGTLTVPGGLRVLRPPAPMAMHGDTHWGAIRPPDIAAMANDTATAAGQAAPAARPSAPTRQTDRMPLTRVALVVTLGLAAVGAVLLLGRGRMLRAVSWQARRRRQ